MGAQQNGKIGRARPSARGRSVRQVLRGGGFGVLPPHWEDAAHQGAVGEGLPEYLAPGGIISFSIVRFQFYALYLVVKYHHVYVMILCIYIYSVMI